MFSFNGSDSNYLKYKELSNRFEGVPFFDIFFLQNTKKNSHKIMGVILCVRFIYSPVTSFNITMRCIDFRHLK